MMVFFWGGGCERSRETLHDFFMTQETFDMVALVCPIFLRRNIFSDSKNAASWEIPPSLTVRDVGTSESGRKNPVNRISG